ncbi:MAG TPA: magnesium-transporting ATPase, partial [Lachnospiraceae bacterium]|nr:magnesium-transporting ATPase [Lachnospiraceae bacterium]
MKGLTKKQVQDSRRKFGSNKLPEPKNKKWFDFAVEALSERITQILIVIALLQLFLGIMGVMDLSDPIMILVVLAIVTCIAVKTGLSVQKSSMELRLKTSVRYCNVIRDGKIQTINKDEIVVGDLVCIGMGQEIFADGYIVEGKVSVNNAAINGETKECQKTPINGYVYEKTNSTNAYTNQNHLFAGTTVMSGEGKMIVTDVGVNTVNGDTLMKMQTLEAPKTALDIALDNLSDFISKWGTIAAIITFAVLTFSGIVQVGLKEYFNNGILNLVQRVAQNFSVALTIIVAAVPEGLPLIVKLVTKQNVKTMEKFNILAKNPSKIPELAYVDIICTDKTGTLTTGVMTPKKIINATGRDVDKKSFLWKEIETNICLNNSATFDSENNIIGGNSIDRAILNLICPEKYIEIKNQYPEKLKQIFNSENKYSAFTTQDNITYYKGAPEKLIQNCTTAFDAVPFNDIAKEQLYNNIKSMTQNGMRCIALTMADGDIVENILPN